MRLTSNSTNKPTKEHYVANGEQARVERIEEKYIVARLWNPDRLIRIPRSKRREAEDDDSGEETGGGKRTSIPNWDLAYAISVHKSQGSDWKVVIVAIDAHPGAVFLCTKEWIYTAISRAKEICLMIGQRRVVQSMCKKSGIWSRKTFLRESIDDLRGKTFEEQWGRELQEACR